MKKTELFEVGMEMRTATRLMLQKLKKADSNEKMTVETKKLFEEGKDEYYMGMVFRYSNQSKKEIEEAIPRMAKASQIFRTCLRHMD